MKGWVARLMGRSVADLATEVDNALGQLAFARGNQAMCQEALDLSDEDVKKAMRDVESARDALFKEHPELRPDPVNLAEHPGPVNLDPTKFEVVEVDDADDPRYASGVASFPMDDNEPLPPLVWGEHDG